MKLTLRDMSEVGDATVRIDVYLDEHKYVGELSLTHDEHDQLQDAQGVGEMIEVEIT